MWQISHCEMNYVICHFRKCLEADIGVEKRKSDTILEATDQSPAKRKPTDQLQWSPDLRRDRRYTQPPLEYHHRINAPDDVVEAQAELPQGIASITIAEPQDAMIVPAPEAASAATKRRIRRPRQNIIPLMLDDTRRKARPFKNDEAATMLLNLSVRQSLPTGGFNEAKDLLLTILAGSAQQAEGDLSRPARDLHESVNASIRSGPREITITKTQDPVSFLKQTEIQQMPVDQLPGIPVSESIPLELPVDMEPTIIEEASPVLPRMHTSSFLVTPDQFDTEAKRHDYLLAQIRTLFLRNGNVPLKIEQLCTPPVTRYKIAVAFQGLLHLEARQYVVMQSHPNSTELNVIHPGRRLF